MNTKAASILMMIFEVLAVLLVVYLTTSIAQAYGKSETVFKINAAEDLRMMTDTLVGVPGDALVRYPHGVSTLSFLLDSHSISVFTKGEAENLWVIRRLYLPVGFTAEGVVEQPQWVCLEKKATKILLRGCEETEW